MLVGVVIKRMLKLHLNVACSFEWLQAELSQYIHSILNAASCFGIGYKMNLKGTSNGMHKDKYVYYISVYIYKCPVRQCSVL